MSRTANVPDDTTTEEGVKKYNIAAAVSQQFQDAVRKAAKEAQFTVSTWLAYHIEKALGRNPDVPMKDADSETVTISTAVPEEIREAIRAKVKDADTTQADFIREVAASAAGYDLSEEPERLPSGEALKQFRVKQANKDAILLDLWSDDPNTIAGMLIRRKQTWTDIGLKPAEVQAALSAGTLTQENYDAVNAQAAASANA